MPSTQRFKKAAKTEQRRQYTSTKAAGGVVPARPTGPDGRTDSGGRTPSSSWLARATPYRFRPGSIMGRCLMVLSPLPISRCRPRMHRRTASPEHRAPVPGRTAPASDAERPRAPDPEQLAGMGPGRVAPGVARQHARQFGDPLLPGHHCRHRHRPATRLLLDDADLRVGARGHLGQVGDDEHLAVGRHLVQRLAQRQARPRRPRRRRPRRRPWSADRPGRPAGSPASPGPARRPTRRGPAAAPARRRWRRATAPPAPRRPSRPAAPPGGPPAMARSAQVLLDPVPEVAGRRRAHRAHGRLGLGQLGFAAPPAGPPAAPPRPPRPPGPPAEPPPRLAYAMHGGQVLAVLAPQLPEQAPALLHLGQALPGRPPNPRPRRAARAPRRRARSPRRPRRVAVLVERVAAAQAPTTARTQRPERAPVAAGRVEQLRRADARPPGRPPRRPAGPPRGAGPPPRRGPPGARPRSRAT